MLTPPTLCCLYIPEVNVNNRPYAVWSRMNDGTMLSLHDKGQMPLGSVIFRAEVQIRTLEISYKAKLGSLVSIRYFCRGDESIYILGAS